MPFNGSGTYTFPAGSFNPATNGANATAADWNALIADLATAVSKMIARDGQSTVTANIPFATFRATGLGDPMAAQDAATKNYVLANPRSYLAGFTLSNDGVTPNTILDIAAGFCLDSTNAFGISGAAFTKTISGAWAAGSGSAGMGVGLTATLSTWYHVFAIINAGAYDVYFDTSVTAANKPASTTAFRRIGSIKLDASVHILAFVQNGDDFVWSATVGDFTSQTVTTTPSTATLSVPPGLQVWARFRGDVAFTSTAAVLFYPLDQAAQSVTVPTGNFSLSFTGNNQAAGDFMVRTNTSAQIGLVANGTATSSTSIATYGWVDLRGRDA